MSPSTIKVTGLTELHQRFRQFPEKFKAAMKVGMRGALYVVWESVPPYPDQSLRPPTDYIRTGTLGRTLGVDEGGGKAGSEPDIFRVFDQGGDYVIGEFGTNLEYAPYVIGEKEQSWQHQPYWWTIATVAERATDKVIEVFDKVAEKLAAFLDKGTA